MYQFLAMLDLLSKKQTPNPALPRPPFQRLATVQGEVQDPLNKIVKTVVAKSKVGGEKEGRQNHHHGCAVDLLPPGPGHASHLGPHTLKITPDLRPVIPLKSQFISHSGPYSLPEGAAPFLSNCLLPSVDCQRDRGRGGGTRTPMTGFGDRQISR